MNYLITKKRFFLLVLSSLRPLSFFRFFFFIGIQRNRHVYGVYRNSGWCWPMPVIFSGRDIEKRENERKEAPHTYVEARLSGIQNPQRRMMRQNMSKKCQNVRRRWKKADADRISRPLENTRAFFLFGIEVSGKTARKLSIHQRVFFLSLHLLAPALNARKKSHFRVNRIDRFGQWKMLFVDSHSQTNELQDTNIELWVFYI